eukprot:scaffold70873_cov69-Phaeocystis_antarctica.AAC.5
MTEKQRKFEFRSESFAATVSCNSFLAVPLRVRRPDLNMLASLKRPAPSKPQDAAERRCKPRATGTEAALAAFRSAARSLLPLAVLGRRCHWAPSRSLCSSPPLTVADLLFDHHPGGIVGTSPPDAELRRLLRIADGCVETAVNSFFAASPPKRTPQGPPPRPTPPTKSKSVPRPQSAGAPAGVPAAAAAPHLEDLEAADTLRHLFGAPPTTAPAKSGRVQHKVRISSYLTHPSSPSHPSPRYRALRPRIAHRAPRAPRAPHAPLAPSTRPPRDTAPRSARDRREIAVRSP